MKKNSISLVFVLIVTLALGGCEYLDRLLSSTPQPTSDLSIAELKYRLIDRFGGIGDTQGIHYCDPDKYPVARVGQEQKQAIKLFSTISADKDLFTAILSRLHLTGTTTFTDDQKLLIYQEYKKLSAITLTASTNGYQFKFAYKDASGGFQVEGVISTLGVITILKSDAAGPMAFQCPICLVGDTLIDTPIGAIAIRNLHEGMLVWTVDKSGHRQLAAILKTAHITVPFGHEVIHVRLRDGRELFASPPHPTADGRIMANLAVGDPVDGSEIVSIEHISYPDTSTYDILPAGQTGFYWANGILIGSTLAQP